MDKKIENISFGVLGGTGVYGLDGVKIIGTVKVATPYGQVKLKIGGFNNFKLAFLNRHGEAHGLPPHHINYRANIFALKKIGVKAIFATNSVGAINPKMKPGDLVFSDQYIDFTKSRQSTFYTGGKNGIKHVDQTNPYCPDLRRVLIKNAKELKIKHHPRGVIAVTEGPRFETPAEINFYKKIGANIVNMTGYPEVALAREAGICYASICVVSNFAAGISKSPITLEEVNLIMGKIKKPLEELILKTIETCSVGQNCDCRI